MTLSFSRIGNGRKQHQAMTLVELMISMSIFSILIIGTVYLHMFGLRQDELVQSKLGASFESRKGFNRFVQDVRSAKIWRVGTGDASSFTAIENGSLQQGTALQLSTSANTNSFIRYYFDVGSQKLCRVQSSNLTPVTIADHLTNSLYFASENYRGDSVSDLSYKYLIHVTLQFSQYQYPLTKVGPNYYYNYYKMEFKVTPHCPDGA
jgi:prepilin-type N-terminal cleavage/methylation domain-containing protein